MSEDLTQKEMLVRLMDEVRDIGRNQTEHISFAKAKLESIEAQALKTNGRVNKLEVRTNDIEQKQEGVLVKVGAIVFVGATIVTAIINKIV